MPKSGEVELNKKKKKKEWIIVLVTERYTRLKSLPPNSTNTSSSQHGNNGLSTIWNISSDAISLLDTQRFESLCKLQNIIVEFFVTDGAFTVSFTYIQTLDIQMIVNIAKKKKTVCLPVATMAVLSERLHHNKFSAKLRRASLNQTGISSIFSERSKTCFPLFEEMTLV